MDWNGLEWNGLDWNGMDWNGMEWFGLGWIRTDWKKLFWIRMDWFGLGLKFFFYSDFKFEKTLFFLFWESLYSQSSIWSKCRILISFYISDGLGWIRMD